MVHTAAQHRKPNIAPAPSNGVTKVTTRPKAACDRCRGQKLRCIWESTQQCRRCARAKANCRVPRPKPLGRPSNLRSNSAHVSYEGCEDIEIQSAYDTSPIDSSSSGPTSWNATAPSLVATNNLSVPSPTLQPDLLEFLNFLPESTFGGILSPNYDSTSFNIESGPDTGPLASNNATTTNVPPLGDALSDQTGLQQLNSEKPGDSSPIPVNQEDHLHCLKELCEINIALFQHLLHANPTPGATLTHSQAMPPTTDNHSSADANRPSFSVADLELGQLLSLTARIKKLASDFGGTEKQIFQDRSTALLALSCYTRLELIYSRMLDALRLLQSSGQHLRDSEPIMPELSIDGFSLGKCRDVQLGFAMQICQEAQDRLRQSVGITGEVNVRPLDEPV
ncbi:hypothetical protein BBP40_008634 [Aspergillus hancockii]|nr:hypothetical protein BBP40_008634 [Aspergillus hancockii]